MPYVLIVIALIMGTFFHRLAVFEQRSPWLWAASSVALACFTSLILHWGFLGLFACQFLLFCAMFADNVIRDRKTL